MHEFKSSGITQAHLARRLGKGQDVISRLLSRAQNWELDTFSELMFGIRGAVPKYTATYPLSNRGETDDDQQISKPKSAPAPPPQPASVNNALQRKLFEEAFFDRSPAPIPADPARRAA
jgi:hypothetical protein